MFSLFPPEPFEVSCFRGNYSDGGPNETNIILRGKKNAFLTFNVEMSPRGHVEIFHTFKSQCLARTGAKHLLIFSVEVKEEQPNAAC